eukprot:TRINITY_DN105044_c0_g1_i1.p1 TRINITY_DN105044_c0_g1~~TRINITY_DN105044_c0_g1_i1.p1  ORF type:complete len:584 (-),score=41.47 TRINITY_DN105044_c0_g1_i1:1487-3238(-)
MAIIRIDLHSMAIAPAHHDLVLKSCKRRKEVVGRLAFEAYFKQSPVVEFGVHEVFVELEGSGDKHLDECEAKSDFKKTLVKFTSEPVHHHFKVPAKNEESQVDNNVLRSMQLIFRLRKDKTEKDPKKAEAVVSLLEHNNATGNEGAPQYHTRQERAFSEPLRELEGKPMGNINGYVSIKRIKCKIIEQIQDGVHSEHGIGLAYPSVLVHDFVSEELPKEIMMLQALKEQFQKTMIEIKEGFMGHGSALHLIKEVSVIMRTTLFGKERHRSFFYPSLKSLHKSQEIMLLTADRIAEYFESLPIKPDQALQPVAKATKSIMKRNELARPQILTHKNTNSGLYHKVLSKFLSCILPYYFSSKTHKSFKSCSLFLLALAYYNFPSIRKGILEAVRPTSEQFTGVLPDMSPDNFKAEHNLPALIAAFLESEEKGDEKLLITIGHWLTKLQKCTGTFYRFLSIWMKYSERLLRNAGKATWKCIEGYWVFIKGLLQKIKCTEDIKNYSTTLKNAVWSVLANEELLYPIIHLVFTKTKQVLSLSIIARTIQSKQMLPQNQQLAGQNVQKLRAKHRFITGLTLTSLKKQSAQ